MDAATAAMAAAQQQLQGASSAIGKAEWRLAEVQQAAQDASQKLQVPASGMSTYKTTVRLISPLSTQSVEGNAHLHHACKQQGQISRGVVERNILGVHLGLKGFMMLHSNDALARYLS